MSAAARYSEGLYQPTITTVKKPWMLLASYDVAFDNLLSIQTRIKKLQKSGDSQQRVEHLQKQCESISKNLVMLDGMIHQYISTHEDENRHWGNNL